MIVKNNLAFNMFQDKWEKEVQRMINNGIKKIPDHPGAGWLAGIATKYNLCSAVWLEHGNWVICAEPLKKYGSEDPYYCTECYAKIQEYNDSLKRKIDTEPSKPMKNLIEKVMPKEDDLPF